VPTTRPQTRAAVVVMAAGSGSRLGLGVNKVLVPLCGRPMLCWSLEAVSCLPEVVRVVVVTTADDLTAVHEVLRRELPDLEAQVVTGGSTRHLSEWSALQSLEGDIRRGDVEVVAVHDAARPLVSAALLADVIAAAAHYGGAVPVRPQRALVPAAGPRSPGSDLEPNTDRNPALGPGVDAVTVQTPQAFAADALLWAYESAARSGFEGTDTSSSVERFTDLRVRCVVAPAENIKVTVPADLGLAARLISRRDASPGTS
jgi:2-C-methyl-D-erythritol 4-phosphate cytidylyltransferase